MGFPLYPSVGGYHGALYFKLARIASLVGRPTFYGSPVSFDRCMRLSIKDVRLRTRSG
jgi:hypothetical protein